MWQPYSIYLEYVFNCCTPGSVPVITVPDAQANGEPSTCAWIRNALGKPCRKWPSSLGLNNDQSSRASDLFCLPKHVNVCTGANEAWSNFSMVQGKLERAIRFTLSVCTNLELLSGWRLEAGSDQAATGSQGYVCQHLKWNPWNATWPTRIWKAECKQEGRKAQVLPSSQFF